MRLGWHKKLVSMKLEFRILTGHKGTNFKAEQLCFKAKCRDWDSCSGERMIKCKTTRDKSDSSSIQ